MSDDIDIVCRICGRTVSRSESIKPENWARIHGANPPPLDSVFIPYSLHLVERTKEGGKIAAECQDCWTANHIPLLQKVIRS